MADITEIKHRIKSIQDTHQITKAMELISVAKMRKAIQKQSFSSVYFDTVRYTLKDIMRHSTDIRHKYIDRRPDNRTAYIVVAGDKGLAGAFNNNVLNLAWKHMQERPVHYIVTIGQMARAYFESRKQPVDLEFTHAVASPTLHDARGITRDILDLYDRNLMDEVYVVFTRMFSTSVHEPVMVISDRHDLFRAHSLGGERACGAHDGDVKCEQKRRKDARCAQSRIQPPAPERHHDRAFRPFIGQVFFRQQSTSEGKAQSW